ncbi:Retrotransposon Copia-like N-terminal [Arabidopsis suecica]|nr:Retrotransposon Copia-like N-terminal [Arabidopsis suecica]
MASETVITSDSTSLLNVNMTNVTKLTSSNFLMWRRQVQALLNGYDLTGYIDGSIVVPPATITANGAVTVNPAFKHWQRQDQLIYSALLGAISISVQPILSRTTTSAEIWTKLMDTYAKPSWSHIQQLRQQIKQWKKDTKSIDEFFQGLVMRFDQLALLGKPMESEEQMEVIVEGLSDDYKQ